MTLYSQLFGEDDEFLNSNYTVNDKSHTRIAGRAVAK